MRIGTIKQIWRYAVKSMAGEQLDSCEVGGRGIPGDRGWAIRNEITGDFRTGSKFPVLMQCSAVYVESPSNGFVKHVDMLLPDGRKLNSNLPDIDTRLTELLGEAVLLSSLERETSAPHYFDAFPVHVLTTSSLAEMARLNPLADWDVRRFRPNFFVETDPGIEGLIETEWNTKTLRLGSVEIKCETPAIRCGMTIQSQAEIPKDPSILRTIVKYADENLGVYASVTRPGNVKVGDVVEVG